MMEYAELCAKRILELCQAHSMTLEALAEASGVHLPTVEKIVSAKTRTPHIGTLRKFAQVFGMSLSEFMDF